MNFLYFLNSLSLVILILLIVNVFKPFIGSYSAKKGENLATKEDIAQLTKIAEGIKAKISDEIWDRQRQWKLRRDAIINAIQTQLDLFEAAKEFSNSDSSATRFNECRHRYVLAFTVMEIIVGKEITKTFKALDTYVDGVAHGKETDPSEINNKFDNLRSKVISSARDALGIKDTDELSQIEDRN